jgi:hypothetical protein
VIVPPKETNADWPQPADTANKSYGHLAWRPAPSRAWSGLDRRFERQRAASPRRRYIGDGRST